jgi:hypothetical protein
MLLHLLRHDIAVDRGNGSTISDVDRLLTSESVKKLHCMMVRMRTTAVRDPSPVSTFRAQP